MTIEWYPGHMKKAHEQLAELVRRIDVFIEVLDARLPVSSANHLLAELRRNKPWIKVLNKNDLADPVVTKAWVRFFEQQAGIRALPLSAKQVPETSPTYPVPTIVMRMIMMLVKIKNFYFLISVFIFKIS